MNTQLRVGILGAGLGSRLSGRAKAKPLAKLGNISLLERLLEGFRSCGVSNFHCALREELLSQDDKNALPTGPRYLFVNTESSLHTLGALVKEMSTGDGPALFSMADTVLRPEDLRAFVNFCRKLAPGECAVLVTTFVDDEKPLWVHLHKNGDVEKFSAEPASHVTSGMYFLQPQAMEIVEKVLSQGTHKMRNFLSALAERHVKIKTFVVSKTIDVDHPSDLDKAEDFLHSG